MLKFQPLRGGAVGLKEKYELTWPGKKQAKVIANTPTTNTLRPIKEKSVDFDNTQNIYIEGDNLEALKILQESYLGKIKCIYIDPPYNTGNDFIYKDNFNKDSKEELEESGQVDDEGNRLVKNADSSGRYHSDWLSMMYPRLKLARNLLSDDGVIFISIDDKELSNLKKVCDEIYGEANFISNIIWQSTVGSNTGENTIITVTENILVYSKTSNKVINKEKFVNDGKMKLQDEFFDKRGYYALDKLDSIRQSSHYTESMNYAITCPDGTIQYPGGESYRQDGWNYLWSKTKVEWGLNNGFIEFKKNGSRWNIYNKRYELVDNCDNPYNRGTIFKNIILSSFCTTSTGAKETEKLFGEKIFDYPKPTKLLKKIEYLGAQNDSIILDFFSGSAGTAHAVMKLNAEDNGNRKYVMIQFPEITDENGIAKKAGYDSICDIGEERIRRAANKIKEENGLLANNLDLGFRVYKLDSSNMKDVYYKPNDIDQVDLTDLASNIKEDRTAEDLLTQVILDLGLTLDLKIEEKKIKNNNVFFVADNALVACFDDEIDMGIIDEICKCKPLKLVLKDSSFKNDSDKINYGEKIKKLSPETEIKVL